MRGALNLAGLLVDYFRIIPADAGSTSSMRSRRRGTGDHPRGCGEHKNVPAIRSGQRGSSPRMRGAHDTEYHQRTHAGIIPADAGSTMTIVGFVVMPGDHPRGCGEH